VNYSYVSVPVGENTVQITPVSGHYYEMYQISRPTVMGWGSSVDGSALFNAVQAAYNSVSVDTMYSPPDIDSKIIQKYISGSSSALSKEAFTAILLEYIDQNEPILPLNGVFTAEGDGTCIIIDRKIVSTAKNDAGGYIRFPEIVYGNTGTHNYMIREMIPAESKGYFYDKGYLDVKVDISQDEQGQLSAAIDPSQGKTFKNTAIYTLPSTGGMGVIPFIAAGSVCTIAALLLIIRRRKEMQ
jgi:pilin isopeptide linkage protein/LPXTG-motif cell wall-anchored protein